MKKDERQREIFDTYRFFEGREVKLSLQTPTDHGEQLQQVKESFACARRSKNEEWNTKIKTW